MMENKPVIDVKKVADLAKLEIEDSSIPEFQKDMERIVEYVDLIGELNLEGVEPTAHPLESTNVWREDIATDSFSRESMLENAPSITDNQELIRVPKVIAGEETE